MTLTLASAVDGAVRACLNLSRCTLGVYARATCVRVCVCRAVLTWQAPSYNDSKFVWFDWQPNTAITGISSAPYIVLVSVEREAPLRKTCRTPVSILSFSSFGGHPPTHPLVSNTATIARSIKHRRRHGNMLLCKPHAWVHTHGD